MRSGSFTWVDGGRYPVSTCHVRNLCHAIVLAAQRGSNGGAYFVTDGEPLLFRELVTGLLRARGLRPGERSIPRWLASLVATAGELLWRTLPLPGSPPLTRAQVATGCTPFTVSDARARKELAYAPVVSFAEGIAELGAATERDSPPVQRTRP